MLLLILLTVLFCILGSVYLTFYMINKRNIILKEFEEEILNKYELKKE